MSGRMGVVGRRFGRDAALVASIAAALLGLLACAPPGERAGAAPTTLRILYPGEEHALGMPYDMSAKFLVFLPLSTWTASGPPPGVGVREASAAETEPRLARSWERSPDHRSWTVRLRSDVRWHDGLPVTAHDVKFSLDLMRRPEVGWVAPDAFAVRVLDDTTYTVAYRKPGPGHPLDTWTVYYPRHLLEGLDPARWGAWEFWTRPVGNGPYRYVRHLPGQLVELEANPDYYRGRPRVDRVVLRFGGQPLAELLAGNVDVIALATEADLLKLRDDRRFRTYHAFGEFAARAIVWNHRHPAFADARVRRALAMAIDRRELLRVLNLPDDAPLFDVLFTADQFRRGELPPPLPHDLAEAERLLEAAGWRDADGDGIRERDGRKLEFSLLVGAPTGGPERAAVFAQSELRRVGVRAVVQQLEVRALFDRIRARAFDAVLAELHMRGDRGGGSLHFEEDTPIGYVNPRLGGLLRAKTAAFDPAEVDRLYRETWPIFRADLPVTFLHPLVRTTIAHRRVRGLSSPYRIDPVAHMEEVWLEEGR